MRRSSRKRDAAGVSLFPFLAVLLCTMGSLIVLLMQIVAQARVQTLAAVEPEPPAPSTAPLIEPPMAPPPAYVPQPEPQAPVIDVAAVMAERAQRRNAQLLELAALEQAMTQLSTQTAEGRQAVTLRRSELDAAAAELRRLQAEANRLAQLELELDRPGVDRDRLALAAAAEALKKKLVALTSDIEKAKRDASLQKPSFAVIPFTGPNQTRRRPIYIECRVDAIEIQPEGIEFSVDDFRGPMGPGNPLASTVRTIADYYRAEQRARGEYGVPYPLLLVRPDGIVAYYTARDALAVMGTEFGYELIEADWKLDFPPADPELLNQAHRALEQARRRQRELAAAAPRLYGRGGAGGPGSQSGDGSGEFSLPPEAMPPAAAGHYPGSRKGSTSGSGLGQPAGAGGTDRTARKRGTGSGSGGGDSRGDLRGGSAADLTGQTGTGGNSPGVTGTGTGTGGGQPGGGYPVGNEPGSGGSDGPRLGDGRGGSLDGNGNNDGRGAGPGGDPAGGPLADSIDQAKNPLRSRRDVSSSGAIGASPGAGNQAGGSSAQAAGGAGQTGLSAGPAGAVGRPGSGGPGRPALRGAAGVPSDGSPDNEEPVFTTDESASVSDRPQTGSSRDVPRPGELRPRQTSPLTKARGQGWAMPEVARSSIAASRPITIDCYRDRLVVQPGRKVIPLDTHTADVVDELLGVVRERVRSWGIAGQGVYWKPDLVFHVAPDGAERFVELKQWLDGSGLEVRAVQK